MGSKKTIFRGCVLALAALTVSAQQPVYGQCGGIGWTGATTCASGSTCVKSNDYYSQCLPGSGSGTTTTLSTSKVGTTTTTTAGSAPTSTGAITGTKYMFIFGDSYTATNSFSGYSAGGPYPSTSNPIGSPALPGSTFSGGYNWVGDLVTKYETSTTFAYNFAVGGATVDKSLVAGSTTTDMVTQVSQWSSDLASKPSYAPWTSTNAIAGAFFGVNDILGPYWNGQAPPTSSIMTKYMAEFQILYNAGVRNFFVVQVPPLQYTPIIGGSSSTLTSDINAFNSALTSALASFKSSNSGVNIAVSVSLDSAWTTAINNPTAYGAPDAKCYNSNGVSCLWWDNLHPATQLQNLMAQAIANALKGSFF